MSNLREECSLYDCKKLKQMIIENPDLPLLVMCGEYSWNGGCYYEAQQECKCFIEELTLYNNKWLDKDDYEETLSCNLDSFLDKNEYKDLTDDEICDIIKEKINNTEFIEAICVYC